LNDVVVRALTSGIPVTKEPTYLSQTDGKRPDGMGRLGRESTLADSYVDASACGASAVAEIAATCKMAKGQLIIIIIS